MSYTRAIQTSHASNIPRLSDSNTSSGVDTVDILTRGREDNVGYGNTRDGKLGRIDLDQHVKAVEIGHTRYVNRKVDNGGSNNQSNVVGLKKNRLCSSRGGRVIRVRHISQAIV